MTKPGAVPAATPEGTASYAHKFGTVRLGRAGWTVSPVGFGTYRVGLNRVHEAALEKALTSGVNLIDTSTNYGNGDSETTIGNVLSRLFKAGGLRRDQIVIVTKAGYVQGENLRLARERESQGRAFAEMVKYTDGCWHCISPEFLETQLQKSLERLQLEKVDVLLLHNPEYFLKSHSDHREYYRRIKEAFLWCEKAVQSGRIQYYGVSSNTFPEPREAPEFTSLETLIDKAREAGSEVGAKRDHFAVIQFPFNLYEPGAAFEANNTGKSVTELAVANGIGTLINRPLNAFQGNQLLRLADFPHHHGVDVDDQLMKALDEALKFETSYPGKDVVPARQVCWAHMIRHNFRELQDLDHWKMLLRHEVMPQLERGLDLLREEGEATKKWAEDYKPRIDRVLTVFTQYLEQESAMRSRRIAAALDQGAPPLRFTEALSQKAIRLYRALPGIDCVLVGMRRPEYVDDVLAAMKPGLPKVSPEQAVDALEIVHERAAQEAADDDAEERAERGPTQ